MTGSGLMLIDKPQGITSHDVVARVRRLAGTRKVGHAGTLDPMATGLLIVGLNSSTRLLTYVVGAQKEYRATIRLGASTLTDDAEGEILTRASPEECERVTEQEIRVGIAGLTGAILQVPSLVSAIKVNGQRSYARVRAGEDVVLEARPVTVSAFDLLGVERGDDFLDLDVRVECSSGTYIRALARDLGTSVALGGHLVALRRTTVGPFDVQHAHDLDSLVVENAIVSAADAAATLFRVLEVSTEQARDLGNGKQVVVEESAAEYSPHEPVAAITGSGQLIGLVELRANRARVLVNFPVDERA